jgi:Patatin-like phospholipase
MSGFLWALALVAVLAFVVWAQRRGPFLQYLYFCRFPLLAGLALVALPPLSIYGAPSLLGNFFWLSRGGILLVSLLSTLAAWVVMVTLEILVAYAPLRFGVRAFEPPSWLLRFRVPLFALLALPVTGTAVAQSPAPLAWKLEAAAAGAGVAAVLFLLAFLAYRKLGGRLPLAMPVPPPANPEKSKGYVDPRHGKIGSGHVLGVILFLITAFLYVLGYLFLRPDRTTMPSLGYLMLLLILLSWALPGISFALDRYRVPVLLVLIAASFLSSQVFDTDHYYRIVREAAPPAPLPGQAFGMAERRNPEEGPIVVVAASGGGITASLWTARVLTTLQEEVGTEFTRSIRLISSVSGGSVGTMYFLDRFTPSGYPAPGDLPKIVEAAGAPSLEATAWGVTYPDLFRVFLGFLPRDKTLDRGWAVEQSWKRHLANPGRRLSEWRTGVRQGWLPAAVLNATVVETGEQFLLTPLDLPQDWRARRFYDVYPGYDVPVVTAARLSATFPWVSPITQAITEDGSLPPGRELHLADGGYYDNFGVVTAVNWLRSLVPVHLDELKRRGVLLVLIRAFREEEDPKPAGSRETTGWLYTTVGPILTISNVRNSTQAFRNSVELEMLGEDWDRAHGVKLTTALFELREKAPLSWKLTRRETEKILAGWNEGKNRAEAERVKALFRSAGPPAKPEG